MNKEYLVRHKIPLEFELVDDNNTPINLTDKTVTFSLNNKIDNITPIINKPCTINEPEKGLAEVILSTEETNIAPGKYFIQLDIDDGTGQESVMFENSHHLEVRFKNSIT